MNLWLARHARPLVDAGLCYGASDVRPDPAHTREAAAALSRALPARLAVASSPRTRCTVLAQALCDLRPGQDFAIDARLAEMDFGDWEGRPWSEIGQAAIDAWAAGFPTYRCGGGESAGQLLRRVAAALDAACAAGDEALWVTHAGVARAVRVLLAPAGPVLSAATWPRDGLAFGAVECIALDPILVRRRLRENAHAHACP